MTMETYTAFLMFVIVMTGTPGMGNLSMMAIGQTTGFRSSLPFLLGTTVGAMTLDTTVALGLGGLFMTSPEAAWVMRILGMAYIIYLGWRIITMQLAEPGEGKRFTFVEGLFLHPTNPKSWTMAVVGFSQIANPNAPLLQQVAIFVLTFTVFQVSFHSLWGLAGVMIMRTLRSRNVMLAVNTVLVTVMVGATAYAMFI
ncbi:LysE family translocator [Pseudodesulfovibrio sp. zrk46]|uniref:LysE family translocator n=1 Tax=Pseudodesulfovibrio sp. zrk46 TaxID=2725288 RepID=UPI0014493B6C|nr:LysE family translocator [Pseudodesulfovibrio sp. zrk46]QJB56060.1 LysE family translocator [Pseudodesulfovibrio sp. zrk46]